MNQNDPEVRIAELERRLAAQKRMAEQERQLTDAKAAAGPENGVGQPPQFLATQAVAWQDAAVHKRASGYLQTFQSRRRRHGRNDLYWWIIALIPVCWISTQFFGLRGLIIALAVFAAVVVSHVVLTRRGLDGEKIVGGSSGCSADCLASSHAEHSVPVERAVDERDRVQQPLPAGVRRLSLQLQTGRVVVERGLRVCQR